MEEVTKSNPKIIRYDIDELLSYQSEHNQVFPELKKLLDMIKNETPHRGNNRNWRKKEVVLKKSWLLSNDATQTELSKLHEKIQGFLSKIDHDNFDQIVGEILKTNIKDLEQLDMLTDIFFQ